MTHHPAAGIRLTILSIVFAIAWPVSLESQELLAALTGQLIDQTGNVLPGVRVVIRNRHTDRVSTVMTDGTGRFQTYVEPGSYVVRFELSDFAPQGLDDLDVQVGRTYQIDATLRLAGVSEALEVTSEPPTVLGDMRSALVAHSVPAEEFDRLPKQRTYQWMALTAPSVNQGDIEGGFQVNGASGAENTFTVDGVNTTSLINGASRQNAAFEYIDEVQLKTTGIPAEYASALGGVISAVTKSGGNIFTGELHYYLDASPLSAGPVKRLALSPVDESTVQYIQDEKMPEHRHEFGASLGGPIVRNRIFFFGSFSPRMALRSDIYKFLSGAEQGEIKRKAKLTHGCTTIRNRNTPSVQRART